MKKLILFLFPLISLATFTLEELNFKVQKGEEIFNKLKNQKLSCENLTEEDFENLGEYFMALMIGDRETHLAMNQMMKNMHGEEGERLMHLNMGKRFSGCFETSPIPSLWMMPGMPRMDYWMEGWNFFNWKGWNILAPILGIFWFLWLLIIIALPILVLILIILEIIYLIKKKNN